MEILYENLLDLTLPMVIMWVIGGVLIYLAIAKDMEPHCCCPLALAPSWSTCPTPAPSPRSWTAWRNTAH